MLRKNLILIGLVAVLVAALAPATASAADPRGVNPSDPNPLAGETFYNQPDAPAMNEWRHLVRIGQKHKADLIWKIAGQPKAMWFGRFTSPHFFEKVRRRIDPARARGEVPIFTVLRAQATGCSPTYQGGGPAEDSARRTGTTTWPARSATTAWSSPSSPTRSARSTACAPAAATTAYACSRYGVDVLSKLPNATVYLEAGASDWESAARTAKQLRVIGIRKVRGFMLNVTHYDWTANNIQHGLEISRLTGGKHFIINTAENGRGAVHYKRWINRSRHIWRRINVWCNPRHARPGPGSHHAHVTTRQGRRLPVDQPARVRAELPAPADRLVPAAGADAGEVRDQLGAPAPRHRLRLQAALPAEPLHHGPLAAIRATVENEQ